MPEFISSDTIVPFVMFELEIALRVAKEPRPKLVLEVLALSNELLQVLLSDSLPSPVTTIAVPPTVEPDFS